MRFGLFFQVPESDGHTHAERYAEMFELIALADALGFDVAWLAELHFGGAFSLLSNPLMTVPVIAQRTKRIRIGTAVTLLPLHHPLSCAEQAATADLLSGGRLEFGVGRGSIPTQFHGFRVPTSENRARFDEALDVIRLAWTQDRFSYRIVDRLQAAREEFGLSQVICWFDQGSMLPRDEVERTMRRFAEQVMPKLGTGGRP